MHSHLFNFDAKKSEIGSLVAIQSPESIPFDIQRVYYIYGVDSKKYRRGFHAHRDLEQVLICVKGSLKVLVKTPKEEIIYSLSSPDKGLFIGKMIWREMFEFSKDAVLLVLASKKYDEGDYYREYSDFENAFFSKGNNL
jgi:dTDP-4-dehydrorhamnose 3,5-epimerase-like enzyme